MMQHFMHPLHEPFASGQSALIRTFDMSGPIIGGAVKEKAEIVRYSGLRIQSKITLQPLETSCGTFRQYFRKFISL